MKLCLAQPLLLRFQVMMRKSHPSFFLMNTPIFEDEDDMDGAGDAGASAPAVAPAPSVTSSED